MFNPEFRYLLVQEEPNDEFMPIIDNHIIAAICVCGVNAVVACGALMAAYKLFLYAGGMSKYLWTALWNSLTPGNQWLDLAIIISSLICSVVMVMAMRGMADVLDSGFIKLKNEIKKKDERIKELEAKLETKVETKVETNVETKVETNVETKVETEEKYDAEEEADKLEAYFSRKMKY
jgi:hypothetical protein